MRLVRLANPLVRTILRSRAHRLLSGRLLLLAYRGRRSGRAFTIPLRYAETDDGRLIAVAVRPAGKLWWRSFREPARAVVLLRGEHVPVTGTLARGEYHDSMLARYNAGSRRLNRAPAGAAVIVLSPAR